MSSPVVLPANHAFAVSPGATELCADASYQAGFRGSALVTAIAVAMAESTCNPGAIAVHPNSTDRGLFQLNSAAHPTVPDSCAFNAHCNAAEAYRISGGGTNWRPWVVVGNGAYEQFQDDALIALGQMHLPLVTGVEVVVRDGGRYDVFARMASNQLVQWWYDGQWHGPVDLGRKVLSAPAVTVDSGGRYDVFAIGENHQLVHRIYTSGGGWTPWEDLGGVLVYGISVVRPTAGRFDVFGVDTDYHLVQKVYTGGGTWGAWNDLGGVLRSAPSAVTAGGRYDVFATDTNRQLVQKIYYGDGNWSSWYRHGGTLTSAPSVIRRGGSYDVFATDTDHHLVHRFYGASGWSSWNDLGGVVTVAPSVVSPSLERYDVFSANTDHHLVQKIYNGTWNPFRQVSTVTLAG